MAKLPLNIILIEAEGQGVPLKELGVSSWISKPPLFEDVVKALNLVELDIQIVPLRLSSKKRLRTIPEQIRDIFLASPGKILSKSFIENLVWPNEGRTNNLLRVYINYLRNGATRYQVDAQFEPMNIDGIRDEGYRYNPKEQKDG